jgi:AcrR family transcriptional regulator
MMMLDPKIDFKETVTEARRHQILQGAAQVFAKKGFHKATTRQIAQAAGVAEGTIYNYFDNKRELLFALVEMIGTQSIKHGLLENPPTDPREFLTQFLHDRYQLLQQQGHIFAPILAEIFADADLRQEFYDKLLLYVSQIIEQYFQANIDAGLFRPFNVIVVTRAMIGAMMVNSMIRLTQLDSRYDAISAEAMIEELVNLFLAGMVKN